ncbi:MAG: response regulator transcription factor [Ruminococcus sp.]|nr:response regulator transcription factor [Ruminococcus sp.]
MIRVTIVEDEEQVAENIKAYIAKYQEETGIPFEVTHYRDGLFFLENYKPTDVVFMDIRMPHVDGMTAAKRLREQDENVILVFVTNMAQFAIKGYEVEALDFILKPVRYQDFVYRLKKIVRILERDRQDDVVIRFDREMRRISKKDVYYILVDKKHLVYHTAVGCFEVRESLRKAGSQLPQDEFVSCCSGYLVNLNFVREVKGNEVNVAGDWLPISRPKRKQFLEAVCAFPSKEA